LDSEKALDVGWRNVCGGGFAFNFLLLAAFNPNRQATVLQNVESKIMHVEFVGFGLCLYSIADSFAIDDRQQQYPGRTFGLISWSM